jgi:ribosomal protein S14
VVVCEYVGGLHERQVQLQGEVCDQVRAKPHRRQPVAEVVRCSSCARVAGNVRFQIVVCSTSFTELQ